MACTTIYFKRLYTGALKETPVGFSWSDFFFGFFPSIFRADWNWAVIKFILAKIAMNLSSIVLMFFYSKPYIKDLICAGFKAFSITSGDINTASSKLEWKYLSLKWNEI